MQQLNRRQKEILRCTIRQYVDSACPVGSKHLVKQYSLVFSPATIRSEMSNLEDMGYLSQPHVSAGRVPTEKGYRFYVDTLMQSRGLSREEKQAVQDTINDAGTDMNTILVEASKILSSISQELSVVITPWIAWGVFDKLELIPLTEGKALAVIYVKSRLVKTVVLKIDADITESDLLGASSVLNERLSGLTLQEIQETIQERIRDVHDPYREVVNTISCCSGALFNFAEPLDVHYSGTRNIIRQPEFSSSDRMESLFALIDDKNRLKNIFDRGITDVKVYIGNENQSEELKSLTVVATSYTRGRDTGALGVVGPTRMRYHKIVPLVHYVASTMSRSFS